MRSGLYALCALILSTVGAVAQEKPAIPWETCPCEGKLGSLATITIPDGYLFVGEDGVAAFMEASHNPPSGRELGALVNTDKNSSWFVLFTFSDAGYIKDDERDKLDADALLESMKEGTERGNDERRKRGWSPLEITGWHTKPFYDASTNNLTWATGATSDGSAGVNYSVRLLGRKGVMNVDLVAGPEELTAVIPDLNSLLGKFSFNPGNRYAEFRAGDKVASYGLTALIAGGAGAAAVKSGLLSKIWKFLVFGAIALFGAIKKAIAVVTGRRKVEEDASPGNA